MPRPFRILVGRATWNLTDQAISSVTNAALSLLIARFVDARAFAAYAVSFTLYTLFVGGMRALVSEPLAVRFSRCGRAEYRDVARAAVGGALALGAGAGMLVILVGATLGHDIGGTMIVLGLFLPALLAQDAWRAVFIVHGRPASAAFNDSVWATVQLGLVGWMLYTGVDTAPPLLAGWGLAAVAAALLGIAQVGVYPQPVRGMRWLARQADLSRFYFPQFLAVVGSFQLTLLLVGLVGSVEDVGSLRAALVLLGPLGIIGFSATAFAVPELSRRNLNRRRTLHAAIAISSVLVVASVLWSAILLALPTRLGSELLGDTWRNARAVLPGMVVWQLGTVAVCGASAAIAAKGWARTSFRISAILAPAFLLFGLVGTRLAGASGAAAGMALAQWAIVPVFWTLLVTRTAGGLRSPSHAPGSWPEIAHRVAGHGMTGRRTVMIVSSTSPYPRDNGKRVVMSGFIDYFVERVGSDAVHYVLVADAHGETPEVPCKLHVLARPNTAAQAWSVIHRAVVGRRSCQEALFCSRRLRSELHELIQRVDPAAVIYDTVRLGQHAIHDATRRELIFLDDLFSVRYERMLDADASGELGDIDPLGEFGAALTGPMRWLAHRSVVYRKLLGVERQRIRRSEDASIQSFDASLLLNAGETSLARTRAASSSVFALRPYMPEVRTHMRSPSEMPQFVFLGRLNVPHNDSAITSFLDEVGAALASELPTAVVRIVGRGARAPLRRVAAMYPQLVRLDDYVEDLDALFATTTAMLAPLRYGTGVKVKVLEALARGLPVVGTERAFSGIPIELDGSSGCLVENNLRRWPELLRRTSDDLENARLSRAAREFYLRTYDREVIAEQYDRLFDLPTNSLEVADDGVMTPGNPA